MLKNSAKSRQDTTNVQDLCKEDLCMLHSITKDCLFFVPNYEDNSE